MTYKVVNADCYHYMCEGVCTNQDLTNETSSLLDVIVCLHFTKHSDRCLKKTEKASRFTARSVMTKIGYWLYK